MPLATHAQTGIPPRRIAWLVPGTRDVMSPLIETFRAQLRGLGYVEGQRDVTIDVRWTDGNAEKLSMFAAELVASKPAVIATAGSGALKVLKSLTRSVPVVFATAVEPVEQGFVESLRRPGGNITGITLSDQVPGKLAELIKETIPRAARIAVLAHDADPASGLAVKEIQRPAVALKLELRVVDVKGADGLESAFAEIGGHRPDALYVATIPLFQVLRSRLAELATKARLPLFSSRLEQTEVGGLMSYANDVHENYRRAAVLVDKILKGANPAELPVEQPDRFHLVINLKTAKALGLTIPQSILLRADRVIE